MGCKARERSCKTNLMSLVLCVMPCLEQDLVIVSLMFHGDLSASVDVRVEDLGFGDSNHRTGMHIWSLVLELCYHVLV